MKLDKNRIYSALTVTFASIAFYMILKNWTEFWGVIGNCFTVISPFLTGLCIAFVLAQPMNLIERRLFKKLNEKNYPFWNRARRSVCLILTLILVFGLIAVIVLLIAPQVRDSAIRLSNQLPTFMSAARDKIKEFAESYGIELTSLDDIDIDWKSISQKAIDYIQSGGGQWLGSTITAASGFFSHMMSDAMGFIFAMYILSTKEKLAGQVRRALYACFRKERVESMLRLATLVNSTFSNFVVGQCAEGLILGTLVYIGMTILGLPYAAMIGTLLACTSLIPIFGAFIGTCIGALMIFMVEPVQALWFVIFILVLQQIEGNLIYPRVVGKSIGLPGIWVLAAVTFSGAVFGPGAMLISVPICSVLYTLFREFVHSRTKDMENP